MKAKLTTLKDAIGKPYIGILIDDYPELNKIVLDRVEEFKTIRTNADAMIEKQQSRDKGHRHITVFTPMDCDKNPELLKTAGIDILDLMLFGIGMIDIPKGDETYETFYVLADSKEIQELRHQYNLPDKDLHVTLGFSHKDLFHKPKDISTLWRYRKFNT